LNQQEENNKNNDLELSKGNETKNNYYSNNYYSNTNYYQYNRGGRGRRGRGFNRGRGRYRNNNYSRLDNIYEKELGKENEENTQNAIDENNTYKLEENLNENENENLENTEQNQNTLTANNQLEEEIQDNEYDNAEENFIEEEEDLENKETTQEVKAELVHKEEENNKKDNKEKTEIHFVQNKNVVQSSNIHDIDISNCCSFDIHNENTQNKKNYSVNSFNEVVSSNVQNFSFIGTNPNTNKASSNIISSNTNLNISSSTTVNANLKENTNIKQNQQQYTTSPQMNISNPNINMKNEIPTNNNKFNIPMNSNNMNSFNQPSQGIQSGNLNLNSNQDFFNAYQMQMSSILAQNMANAGLNTQQQIYPMPLFYYPPNLNPGSANADPNMNYANFLPYMGYPMGYQLSPQQAQQQGNSNLNIKEASDLQNKNRKINNSYVNIISYEKIIKIIFD